MANDREAPTGPEELARIQERQRARAARRVYTVVFNEFPIATPLYVITVLLPRLSRALTAAMNEQLRALGVELPHSQLSLLLYLMNHSDRKLNNKLLAEMMSMSHTAMMEHLNRLQKKGYITLAEDPEDRRSRIVVLTPHSLQLQKEGLFEKLVAAEREVAQKAFFYLSSEEIAEFERLIRFVYEGMTDPEEELGV